MAILCGCYQGLSPAGDGATDDAGEDAGDDGGSSGGSDDGSDSGDDDGEAPAGACAEELADLAAPPLRRLTPTEYANSVEALLGVDASTFARSFPADAAVDGFDNNGTNQGITLVHAAQYQAAAESVAATVVAEPGIRDVAVGCDPGADADCLVDFIRGFGRLAFRHPVADAQEQALLALAQDQADPGDPWSGVQLVIEAVLQSPDFLFRPEVGVPVPDAPGLVRLDGYEVATRLSFALLQSTPPPWLLDAAEAGVLDTQAGVMDAAETLLESELARPALARFARQWFRLGEVEALSLDPALYPAFDDALRTAALAEADQLFVDHMYADGSFLEVYRAPYVYANDALAAIYGIGGDFGPELEKVEVPDDPNRGGLFSTAAYSMLTSSATGPSIVLRGRNVRLLALCVPPPPPPDNLDTSPLPGETELEGAARRLGDANCQVCHGLMDPIGLGLHRYDAVGALRTQDEDGADVPDSGEVAGIGEFDDARELGALVADSDLAGRCVAVKLFRYGHGRLDDEVDACFIDELTAAFTDADHHFVALARAFAGNDATRFRPAP